MKQIFLGRVWGAGVGAIFCVDFLTFLCSNEVIERLFFLIIDISAGALQRLTRRIVFYGGGLNSLFDTLISSCSNIAKEVTYPYYHFPTRRGVAALNSAGRFLYKGWIEFFV